MTDFITTLGPLALTLRLHRLADRLADGGRRLYGALDQPLEPNWYALILLLERRPGLSITEVAAFLGISHPAVIDMAGKMGEAGLVNSGPDPDDGRRRVLSLGEEAVARISEFHRLWDAFGHELTDLADTGESGLLASLASIEAQLDERELDERVQARLSREDGSATPRPERLAPVTVRPVRTSDRVAVVHMASELVRAGDTYAFEPETADEDLWGYWSPSRPGRGYVAELGGEVVGAFTIRPNHPGPGSHVANASYVVRADRRGLGVGRQMGAASLEIAAGLEYGAMQFNIVVASNEAAVRLWRSLGFRIVGTIPDGFRLPDGRYVAHHVMYRTLP